MVAFTFFMTKPTLAILPIRAKAFNYKLMYVNVNTTDASTVATALFTARSYVCVM
jgi:hypothetical protein